MSELELAAKVRLADTPPSACASCFGQYPERRHVDFNAAYDGPVLSNLEGVDGGNAMTIDDLVLCENCVLEAARVLDYEPFPTERIASLEERLADAIGEATAARTALDAKIAAEEAMKKIPAKRPAPRPPKAATR